MAVAFSGAQQHPTVQALSSRPGAAYTLYLNFAGFNYTGTWAGGTPGNTGAYDGVASTGSFSTAQNARIKEIWARTAEKYSSFNVNVTTVDPAVAAGQASSDLARQNFYDTTAKTMHTVIGGTGSWFGGGGVSFVGTTAAAQAAGTGYHTNWVFSDLAPTFTQFVAEATAHENGHGLKLWHQSDYNGSSFNTYSSNNGSVGNGSYAPIMGNSYSAQRGLWRKGISEDLGASTTQDDIDVLMTNTGIAIVDDGVGHTLGTATALPTTGSAVNNLLAKGVINPKSATGNFNAIGASNYTEDYFSFAFGGGTLSLQVNSGTQYITPGVADPGATLWSTLHIYTSGGTLVGTGSTSTSTLANLFSGSLAAGNYVAKIGSIGGLTSTFGGGSQFYTSGSYFLTGSGNFTPVPEPATLAVMGVGVAALLRRRKKSA